MRPPEGFVWNGLNLFPTLFKAVASYRNPKRFFALLRMTNYKNV